MRDQRMVEKPKTVDDDQSVALRIKRGFVKTWLRETSQPGMTKTRMNAAKLSGSRPLGYGYSLLDKSGSLAWQTRYFTYDVDVGNAARLKVGNDRGMSYSVWYQGIVIPRLCVGRDVVSSRDVPLEAYPMDRGGRSLALVIVGNPISITCLSGFRL